MIARSESGSGTSHKAVAIDSWHSQGVVLFDVVAESDLGLARRLRIQLCFSGVLPLDRSASGA